MKRISSKQSSINRKLHQAYQKIDNEREPVCEGCGSNENLSHSHLISQADCKGYGLTELIWDEDNIRIHCMNGCHQKWESRDLKQIKTMLDWEKNLEYVRSKSEELFYKIRVR